MCFNFAICIDTTAESPIDNSKMETPSPSYDKIPSYCLLVSVKCSFASQKRCEYSILLPPRKILGSSLPAHIFYALSAANRSNRRLGVVFIYQAEILQHMARRLFFHYVKPGLVPGSEKSQVIHAIRSWTGSESTCRARIPPEGGWCSCSTLINILLSMTADCLWRSEFVGQMSADPCASFASVQARSSQPQPFSTPTPL